MSRDEGQNRYAENVPARFIIAGNVLYIQNMPICPLYSKYAYRREIKEKILIDVVRKYAY